MALWIARSFWSGFLYALIFFGLALITVFLPIADFRRRPPEDFHFGSKRSWRLAFLISILFGPGLALTGIAYLSTVRFRVLPRRARENRR